MESATAPDVAARVIEARQAAGLTQLKLAEATGMTLRAIQTWEYGERVPRMGALVKLAEATGKPVAFFFGDGAPVEPSTPEAA